MAKLLRTLRLDPSDTFVFPRAAEGGEWAVTGTSLFAPGDLAAFPPKMRAAFRAGFLSLSSLGFSTLVEIVEDDRVDADALTLDLARRLVSDLGAPDLASAHAVAAEEFAFAASLAADHEPGTVIALHRTVEDGAIRERFRTLRRREGAAPGADRLHAFARAFEIVEDETEIDEAVDLVGLMGKR